MSQSSAPLWRPPGHFYSPIPDPAEVERRAERIFDRSPRGLPGIDLDGEHLWRVLEEIAAFYPELPFGDDPRPGLRYVVDNDQYNWSDAIFLYGMLRRARPRRVVEVGSGHSTCVTLDTIDLFLGGETRLTCIEPFPARLRSLLHEGDEERVELLELPVQDVPLARFRELAANDVLFVDSTHVAKTGSDVLYLLFEVLPCLAPGVLVHFHDVIYPFEYPRDWVLEGRAWNEAYFLRAFLQYNSAFRVESFNTALELWREDWFHEHMPLCLRDPGGSLWLSRVEND